jgi:hypothetical protein
MNIFITTINYAGAISVVIILLNCFILLGIALYQLYKFFTE